MAEELKDLIEKIQEEGVRAAQGKARTIEDEAGRKAKAIIEAAGREAAALAEEARERIEKMEDGGKASLKQASRDLLITLRKEIASMLDRIVASHVHKALDAEELARIMTAIVKENTKDRKANIVILVKKEDLEKLEKGFLSELRDEIKKGVVLKSSDDIRGGFMISYDNGKSYYDFTDQALARYISLSLKPKLAEIMNGSSA